MEDDLRNEDDLKNENDLKNEHDLKNEKDLKIWRWPHNEDIYWVYTMTFVILVS